MSDNNDLTDKASQAVVEALMASYSRGDFTDAIHRHLHEDCRYTLYMDGNAAPIGGTTTGRSAILAVLFRYREIFDYILFRTRTLSARDGIVRQHLEIILRHRISNERYEGSARFVWAVRDGLIVSCDEYHDAPRFETFFRLHGGGVASGNPAVAIDPTTTDRRKTGD